MFHSRSFIAQAHKIRKHTAGDSAAYARQLEERFVRQLSHLPEEAAAELYAHGTATRTDRDEQIQVLGDLLDLLHQQYDDETDPLLPEDWVLLREIIDQQADELDMNLIQYVMERVVSHRALS
ncbi:MAG: hypothetical protein ACOCYB_10400 [Alkalispirochaeta sp.]